MWISFTNLYSFVTHKVYSFDAQEMRSGIRIKKNVLISNNNNKPEINQHQID